MYAYFDDTKRFWYYLLITYLLCIPFYIMLRSIHISIFFTYSIILVIEFLCYLCIINYVVQKANGYMKAIEDLLYQNCDVKEFQNQVTTLLQKDVKNQTQRCRLQYLIIITLSIQGKTQEVFTRYETMKEDVDRLHNGQKLPIYIAMAHTYMNDHNLDKAKDFIKLAQECKDNIRNTSTYDNEIEAVIQRYRYHLGEESSHIYIAYLKKTCKEKVHTPFHELCMYIQLMEMSKRTKNVNDGTLCAYYIVKHAKDLPCVDAANKLLEGSYE